MSTRKANIGRIQRYLSNAIVDSGDDVVKAS